MGYKDFSKKEVMQILETIQTLITCRNEADIKTVLEKAKELVCGDYSICGLGVCNDNRLIGARTIINSSYPDAWFIAYGEKKLYEIDPIVWWHSKFLGTQTWADTYKQYKEKISPEFIHNAKSFNLNFGISSSILSTHTRLGSIINFAGSKNHFGAHQKAIVDIIIPHCHQAIAKVCKESARKPLPSLTPREAEIIQWIKDGKTNWEISVILNLSERTVKFHIENIKNKLNATNKAHAVAIALEQGQAD
ncbi:MAG: autoinducer binding domain-containing protein [Deltaproteobacteria bacterium]|nr:autoinducer binding domain-containing protein [Deltaproteobacteria bacterium]